MPEFPTGRVTFLFTDIEGSTRLIQRLGNAYEALLQRHRQLIREPVEACAGVEFGTSGDALSVVFAEASAAIAAAAAAQRALAGESWPRGATIRVRMGIHTGEPRFVGDGYVGLDLHRVARISAAGHGGQVLVSGPTRDIVANELPEGFRLRDLGEHLLKDLAEPERLYHLVIPGLPGEFPPPRSLGATPNNLPPQVSSFIGRQREIGEVLRHLDGTRFLTLTGPPGVGKTRLALQVAAESLGRFKDGAFFIPLETMADRELASSAIARGLGLGEIGPGSPRERLVDYLRDRAVLLVLDGLDTVASQAAGIAELVSGAPRARALATCRAVLHVPGERELPVPPLGLPDRHRLDETETVARSDAVALFGARAEALEPAFRLGPQNARTVAEICLRLDGLPLAIELAATLVRAMPPEAILARLPNTLRPLPDRLRDVPARQQTVRDTIAWSHDLLDAPLRRLFARLAVFEGGADFREAEAVCGPAGELGIDVRDGLKALSDRGLVRLTDRPAGESRVTMLETVHAFAAQRLGAGREEAEMRRRHLGAYLAVAEGAAPRLATRQRTTWLDRLERDRANLQASIEHAIEREDVDAAVRLVFALSRFWQARGHHRKGLDHVDRVLALPGLANRPELVALALEVAAMLLPSLGRTADAHARLRAAVEIRRLHGHPRDLARALFGLSGTAPSRERSEVGRHLREALEIYRGLGDRPGAAAALWALGSSLEQDGALGDAMDALTESLGLFRGLEDVVGLAGALCRHGRVARKLGDLDGARASLLEAASIFGEDGDKASLTVVLDDLSSLALAEGEPAKAARLAGAAAHAREGSASNLAVAQIVGDGSPPDAGWLARTQTAAWQAGLRLGIAEAIEEARGQLE